MLIRCFNQRLSYMRFVLCVLFVVSDYSGGSDWSVVFGVRHRNLRRRHVALPVLHFQCSMLITSLH